MIPDTDRDYTGRYRPLTDVEKEDLHGRITRDWIIRKRGPPAKPFTYGDLKTLIRNTESM